MSPRPPEADCTVYKLSSDLRRSESLTLNLGPAESPPNLQSVFVYTLARLRKQSGSECLTLRQKPSEKE